MCDFNWSLHIKCEFIFINSSKIKWKKTTKESNENPPKIKPFTVVRGGDDYINWLKKLISEHWNS